MAICVHGKRHEHVVTGDAVNWRCGPLDGDNAEVDWSPAWQDPATWSQDVALPPRTDKKVDDAITALWYAMDCPPSLPDAVAEYIKRPYPWQVEWLKKLAES